MRRDVDKQLTFTFFSYHKCLETIRETSDLVDLE